MESSQLNIIDTLADRIRAFAESNPEILCMRPRDLVGVDGLILADLPPSNSQLAAALETLQAEYA